MFKTAIAAALLIAPAMLPAQQLGNSMGTNASAQPQSPGGDVASGAAGTPSGRSGGTHHATHGRSAHPKGARSHAMPSNATMSSSAPISGTTSPQ